MTLEVGLLLMIMLLVGSILGVVEFLVVVVVSCDGVEGLGRGWEEPGSSLSLFKQSASLASG